MKLLVVEDDRTVGQYVKRGLEEQQYLADWVGDGAEALRLMTARPPVAPVSGIGVAARRKSCWPSAAGRTSRSPTTAPR